MKMLLRRSVLVRTMVQFRTAKSKRANLTEELMRRLDTYRKNEALRQATDQASTSTVPTADSLASEAFLRHNSSHYESFNRTLAAAEEASLAAQAADKEPGRQSQTASDAVFPFKLEHDKSLFASTASAVGARKKGSAAAELEGFQADRGFFVRGDEFCDEYTAATAAELPEDEMNEDPYIYCGPVDAVEEVEFQMPGQATVPREKGPAKDQAPSQEEVESADKESWIANYGHEDPSVAPSKTAACAGCGAAFHCQDAALPGFVPVELFEQIQAAQRRRRPTHQGELCRRCYMLKEYDFLLNVNVSDVDYAGVMGHLKWVQEALIVLVVDLTDLPGSIHRQLPDIVGDKKPMIVVGNKLDLLPPDARTGYLKLFRETLRGELKKAGFADRFNILHTTLVSAKTGFGIEDLITNIYMRWMNPKGTLRSDIYLVGCTNAGKSTLFNALLQSDLCKVRALDLVERVTTSIWPGTTLSLLKFPLMNPSSYKLELRRRRLLSIRAWAKKEQYALRQLYQETRDPKYATLHGFVGNTFKEIEEERQPLSNEQLNSAFSSGEVAHQGGESSGRRKRGIRLDDKAFTEGHWCYDTPGTVNRDQILNLFTLEELINVIPRKQIVPRTFLVHEGESLFFGGVCRIDVVGYVGDDSNRPPHQPLFLTLFGSERLPVNIKKIAEADAFLARFQGQAILGAPIGDQERLKQFPELERKEFTVEESGNTERGTADVVLSSIGWVLVTSRTPVRIRAYTPGGRGLALRTSPLLPYAVKFRGARIPGTAEYKSRPLFPEPEPDRRKRRRRRFRSL